MKIKFYLPLLVLAFLSCSKKDPEPKNNILFGTKWQTQHIAAEIVWGGKWYRVIHFIDNSEFETYSTKNGNIEEYNFEGSYELSGDEVILKYKGEEEGKVVTYSFLNSGTLKCESDVDYYCEFVKQQ